MHSLHVPRLRRTADVVVRVVSLAMVIAAVGACSSPAAVLGRVQPVAPSRWEVLTFDQDYVIPPAAAQVPPPGVAPHTRTTMWLEEGSSGSLRSVESRTVDRASGKALMSTLWQHGDQQIHVLVVTDCQWQTYPPPTKATRSAVIADAVGPLTDPTAAGYRSLGGGVYEMTEGPSLLVLRPHTSLATRTLTMLDVRTKKTQSVIHDISLSTGQAPPVAVMKPACVPTAPPSPGSRATLSN